MSKWSIAIADDNERMTEILSEIMKQDEDLQVVGIAHNGEEACQLIRDKGPDIMLLDIIMPKLDGLTVMDRVNQDKDLKKPAFIVISAVSQEKMTEDVFDLGADYYILKPFDNETVVNRIKKVHARSQRSFTQARALNAQKKQESQKEYMERNLETDVTNIIHEVGVPAHIKGYQYLRTGVKMAVENPAVVNRITKELYPGIAARFDTTASKVERAIRHAIEVAWNRGRVDTLNRVLGCRACTPEDKPTNGEFIAMLADKLRLDLTA